MEEAANVGKSKAEGRSHKEEVKSEMSSSDYKAAFPGAEHLTNSYGFASGQASFANLGPHLTRASPVAFH
jgi:hypothetical protein